VIKKTAIELAHLSKTFSEFHDRMVENAEEPVVKIQTNFEPMLTAKGTLENLTLKQQQDLLHYLKAERIVKSFNTSITPKAESVQNEIAKVVAELIEAHDYNFRTKMLQKIALCKTLGKEDS
jgi:hypothetical protein